MWIMKSRSSSKHYFTIVNVSTCTAATFHRKSTRSSICLLLAKPVDPRIAHHRAICISLPYNVLKNPYSI